MVRSVADNQNLNSRVKLASPSNATSVPSKPQSRGVTSKQPLRGRPILHYPMPDLSKVKARVNTYITASNGSENREVSSAVACRVVQMEARNPDGMGWKF
jgi:hypothetical protein